MRHKWFPDRKMEMRQTPVTGVAVLLIILATLLLSACSTKLAPRVPFTAEQQANADVADMPNIRFWVDAPTQELESFRTRYRETRAGKIELSGPFTLLALSGGSDNGAYGAGLLAGWTKSGTRPSFTIVSGVSTGALIAPFAFLGSQHDDDIKQFYTGVRRKDIFTYNFVSGVFGGPSLANSKPLKKLIDRHITDDLLALVSAEHAKGRRLYIMTTNLDAQRGLVWDMGAIARSNSKNRLALFRNVILASASIPGVFPPVLIDVHSKNAHFKELHVDGSATSNFFTVPARAVWSEADPLANKGATIYVVKNGTLLPRFSMVKPKSFTILDRALTTVLESYDRSAIINTWRYTKSNGMNFRLSFIDNDFPQEPHELFSPTYMALLYDYGFQRGQSVTHWQTSPPQTDTDVNDKPFVTAAPAKP
jgi:predicted acylesterase/phospholipase RssA